MLSNRSVKIRCTSPPCINNQDFAFREKVTAKEFVKLWESTVCLFGNLDLSLTFAVTTQVDRLKAEG